MHKFHLGDVVTDGTRTGSIADSFYYVNSDDGTQNKPGVDMYPVSWDDGTQGYRHVGQLDYA